MTDVRIFRAATIQDALSQVRAEIGEDAVILKTRDVESRRLPWRKRIPSVEVTVSLGQVEAATFPFADEIEEALSTPLQPNSRSNSSDPELNDFVYETKGQSESRPVNRLEETSSIDRLTTTASTTVRNEQSPSTDELLRRLEAMEQMIRQMGRSHRSSGLDIPDDLFHVYTSLIDHEVEDELARELVCRFKESSTPDDLADPEFAKIQLRAMVESEIHCGDPIHLAPGHQKVVGLIGPTGVGKTTTIAKLAANFRIRDGVKMGLVTVDTYRIAAVEQLRTYAEIIDLPMKVVTSPQEMRRAIDELSGLDLVLVDTAGRSPQDDLKLHELRSLFAEAQVDEVHLVLSMTTSHRNLAETARKFMTANPTSMIATKLDEAAGLGPLLSLSREFRLPLSYVTTGQAVPDDIEPANASRLARLLLGQDSL